MKFLPTVTVVGLALAVSAFVLGTNTAKADSFSLSFGGPGYSVQYDDGYYPYWQGCPDRFWYRGRLFCSVPYFSPNPYWGSSYSYFDRFWRPSWGRFHWRDDRRHDHDWDGDRQHRDGDRDHRH